jgi:zinc transport system ATP-binding protein
MNAINGSPVLEAQGISFSYGEDRVLEEVSLSLRAGDFVALVGPNGSGKSTLLRVLLGLLRPAVGTVLLFGEDPRHLREHWRLGYVPQRPSVQEDLPATVEEVVSTGRLARTGWWRWPGKVDREEVDHALQSVGLDPLRRRRLSELSGGQQQRAFIAKAFAGEPALLVLDEPTAGVDAESQEALARLLARLHEDRRVTTLYVSHEFGAVEGIVERLVLVRGGIVFDGPPRDLPAEWHDPSHSHARI